MSPYFSPNAHTRADGTPIPKPERLAPDASGAERVAFTRAVQAYNAAVNAAEFDLAARKCFGEWM